MAFWGNLEGTLKEMFSLGKGNNRVAIRSNSGVLQGQNNGGSWVNLIGAGGQSVQTLSPVFDGSQLTKDIDVSGLVADARNSIIQLLDTSANNFERIYCAVKATSATNVRIETGIPLPAGTYKLVIIG